MDESVIWLKDLRKKDASKFGSKAANLGELLHLNFSVPEGFILSSEVFDDALEPIKSQILSILKNININNLDNLQYAESQIKSLFAQVRVPGDAQRKINEFYNKMGLDSEYPNISGRALELIKSGRDLPFVSVRSSPVGIESIHQQESVLNIKGADKIIFSVKRCWASLFTARAIFFRLSNSLPAIPSIAVIVQKMITPIKSGTIFSMNPKKNNNNQMMILAEWGITVPESSEPDEYIINKQAESVIESNTQNRSKYITRNSETEGLIKKDLPDDAKSSQTLSQREISLLTRLAVNIESKFNFPQVIEWGIERQKIFLIQTRNITDYFKKPITAYDYLPEASLTGLPLVFGELEGSVKLVTDNSNISSIGSNNIIVTNRGFKGMFPAVSKSSAVVASSGNIISYAAVLSQELNKPCIIGAKGATKMLQDGQNIKIMGGSVIAEPISQPESIHELQSMNSYLENEPKQESVVLPSESEDSIAYLLSQLSDLENNVTEMVYREAEKRRQSSDLTNEDQDKAKLLSELEWGIRDLRKKINLFKSGQ